MILEPIPNHSPKFAEDIIDGMYDWVRVIDKNNIIILMNKAMSEGLGCTGVGQKCFELLGRDSPCENCISRSAVFDGQSHEKQEFINNRMFSVKSSPVKNENNEIIAAVEVLRDVTDIQNMHNSIVKQNEKLKRDLNLSKKIQLSLLPEEYDDERISFAYIFLPCDGIGGDFIDFFHIDENHIGIYVADVQGHGIPASMLTVFLKSSLNRTLLSPALALDELFHTFNQNKFETQLYITVFYAIIETDTGHVAYSNAGHNVAPAIFGHNRFEILRTHGIPISNWLESPDYVNKNTYLRKGDRLFLYTDGLPETKNLRGGQFGEERLLNIILEDKMSNDQVPIKNTLNTLLANVSEFTGAGNLKDANDDITAALLLFK